MVFRDEKEFEDAVVGLLPTVGWEPQILENYDEKQLLQNWANILFDNNRDINRLNDYPLTAGEMDQIMKQIQTCRTPLELNGFINGRHVEIVRDNEEDREHFGKTVSLKIYDRREIAAGQSRYQIARQPRFETQSPLAGKRRGDLMLLINGMPVIHIELKKSGVPVAQACEQIKRYAHDGVYSGLFSLVQVFVAMTPDDAIYFANPGSAAKFNRDYFFHWGDADNEPIKAWDKFTRELLSIPMAHQLIGFYTVADDSDGILKVMRSYQYMAANTISDRVAKSKWEAEREGANQRGGHIWHTTGSGKTMTSFKAAQLIADSKDADKVVFLVDRIELGSQSLEEYRGFADNKQDVQATENTGVLVGRLKSDNPSDTLIVTSIQKMSNIGNDAEHELKKEDMEKIRKKRIVFIVDECHRSTFGKMLACIKKTFPEAMFFGFTGTPIHPENQKKDSTTATIFGNELHRYSIADGIRDRNVLGFDPCMVLTFRDEDLREAVALERAKAATRAEALADPVKEKIYYNVMRMPMPGREDENGTYIKGIEDCITNSTYRTAAHQLAVVNDILEHWDVLSRQGMFHAILATHSIPEAIEYYHHFKAQKTDLKITALFDSNIDNVDAERSIAKGDALDEIIGDYNAAYGQNFVRATYGKMKKDIASRLAHKKPYKHLAKERQIDLLIVVDQMLTGFDSKWINTLYLDKKLDYENIIQAFSRTNRLFGEAKPFGVIKYYRQPHTMRRNIEAALKLYSGDRPYGIFVDKLPANLEKINNIYGDLVHLFKSAGVENFDKLPETQAECNKFVQMFNELNKYLECASVQGFSWDKSVYGNEEEPSELVEVKITRPEFDAMRARYQELYAAVEKTKKVEEVPPYDLQAYVASISTEKIDADYMNSRFNKFLRLTQRTDVDETVKNAARDELHKTFATLSQDKQRIANIILHDMQRGEFDYQDGKTFHDYITEYLGRENDRNIDILVENLGVDKNLLLSIMAGHPTSATLGQYGSWTKLKATIDINKAAKYLEAVENKKIAPPIISVKAENLLSSFILNGGGQIPAPNTYD